MRPAPQPPRRERPRRDLLTRQRTVVGCKLLGRLLVDRRAESALIVT